MRTKATGVVLALALASCGGDTEAVTETKTETITETVTAETPAPSTGATTPTAECGEQNGFRVEVLNAAVPCEQARETAAGYDLDGPKVQEVGAYTCEGGEADTRPVVFTCVAGDNEIVVSQGG